MCYNHNKPSSKMANAIRFLAADAINKSNSGHPGMPLGMADVATVLFTQFIKLNPSDACWFDRDRFVLSAGHGSMLLYSVLYLLGYPDISLDDIKNFRQFGSKTAGHPEYGHLSGIDMTTGPLGQGITSAVGMALAERNLNAKFGDALCNHYTYVIAGDGCLMEGISEEAIALAGHWKLNKLIVFWDNNNITIDGTVDKASSVDQVKRFKAVGWNVIEIDGQNQKKIAKAIIKAQKSKKPSLIACKTTIGFGAPTKCGTSSCHGSPLGAEELAAMREKLNWNYEPFEVPAEVLQTWRDVGKRSLDEYKRWTDEAKKNKEFANAIAGKLPRNWDKGLNALKKQAVAEQTKVATRKASQMCLEKIVPAVPEIIGGSADLAASNLTFVKGMQTITADDYSGNNVMYGIREHAMAAVMNGMALHGGIIPYGGTFFVFSDYMRPSIRLSALMGLRVIYVLTHDSIGVGEDGPTHQPIEHLASYRAMPNVMMFRPCDVVETAEAWQLAIETENKPSLLALSRQNLPTLRHDVTDNLSAKGGYVISDVSKGTKRQATIIATGSEVSIAVEAQALLREKGIETAVVSMPCTELFDAQDKKYRDGILGTAPRIVVEAASPFGWDKYLGDKGEIIGIDGFGASGPAGELYKHFGITAAAVAKTVKKYC
uniref:Transketolase n=1 Tax=uncultured Alphaproteobacteria bacterium TaxID=91750 RepID=A0A6G8F2U5_9PROT|nr:transketolase [uncultured Alphaproteobacteria bacterium]